MTPGSRQERAQKGLSISIQAGGGAEPNWAAGASGGRGRPLVGWPGSRETGDGPFGVRGESDRGAPAVGAIKSPSEGAWPLTLRGGCGGG
jgi:hypothetical protein